jgi:hypothetical protein
MRLLACLIVAPQRGYDEPAILSYAISSFCPTSADGLHHGATSDTSVAKFTSRQTDVGRSLSADRRSKSKTMVKKGEGDRGDRASE